MDEQRPLDTELLRWARALQNRGLADFVIPLLDVLQVWGFVGAQLLWMVTPLSIHGSLSVVAEVLEQPEALQRLQEYLMEGNL